MADQYLDPISGAIIHDAEGGDEWLNPLGGIINEQVAAAAGDILFQNQLHQIHDGLIAQTASGLNGVLIT